MGVSRKCVKTWVDRYAAEGEAGLADSSSKVTAVRYERSRPGELVHVDVKNLGQVPDGGGWKAHGRGKGNRSRKNKIGFDYVHSMVDDHTRLAYSEVLSDERTWRGA